MRGGGGGGPTLYLFVSKVARRCPDILIACALVSRWCRPQAAYGSANPLYAVRQHAQSSMRASIGELELDEILHARYVTAAGSPALLLLLLLLLLRMSSGELDRNPCRL